MAIVKVKDEVELCKLSAELLHVLTNLRFWTKYWNEHYGHVAKERKEYWEEKADELLSDNGVTEIHRTGKIIVIKEN